MSFTPRQNASSRLTLVLCPARTIERLTTSDFMARPNSVGSGRDVRPFSRDAQRYHQIGIIIAYRRVSTPSAGPHDWPAPSAAQAASGRQPPCAQSRHATLRRKTRHHRLCSAHMRHQSTISADDLIDPGTNFRPGTDRHHSGRRNLGRGSAGPAAAAKSLARHLHLSGIGFALSGSYEQFRDVTPSLLGLVVGRQMPLDELARVRERGNGHQPFTQNTSLSRAQMGSVRAGIESARGWVCCHNRMPA